MFFIDTEDIGQTLTFAFEVSTGSTILCWCSHLLFLSCQFANCLKPFLTSTGLAIFSCMPTTLSSGVALTQACLSPKIMVLHGVGFKFNWGFVLLKHSLLGGILHLLLQWQWYLISWEFWLRTWGTSLVSWKILALSSDLILKHNLTSSPCRVYCRAIILVLISYFIFDVFYLHLDLDTRFS